jgi:hypothetical protein
MMFIIRAIWMYPNGDEDSSVISLYLVAIEKGSSNWNVSCKVSLKSLKENAPNYNFSKHANEMNPGWGCDNLSHTEFFEPAAGYFKDGKFAVICEVNLKIFFVRKDLGKDSN